MKKEQKNEERLTENRLVSFLKTQFNPNNNPGMLGDDAATISGVSKGQLVISMDTICEKVHFLSSTPAFSIGRKLASVTLSDIAAMGAKPLQMLISVALPETVSFKWVRSFYNGLKEMTNRYQVDLIGGDSVSNSQMVFTSAGIGKTILSHPVYRIGAVSGDYIYVTGYFGYSFSTKHHLNFEPRLHEVEWLLSKHVPISSMTDASDGLARSIELITEEQGIGASIELESVPIRSKKKRTVSSIGHALYDGEDFELVFTSPKISAHLIRQFTSRFKLPLTCIGRVNDCGKADYYYQSKRMYFSKKSPEAWTER